MELGWGGGGGGIITVKKQDNVYLNLGQIENLEN